MDYREEQDSLGTVAVQAGAYYGAQSERARQNSIHSGLQLPAAFIASLAMIKMVAAEVNAELGLLDGEIAGAIGDAAREVMAGRMAGEFVVDLFQTGSGTSTNMNMNEVLASRANERLTGKIGGRSPVHPNDHVNLGQSSNDVIPTALHVAALGGVERALLPQLEILEKALMQKAAAFGHIVKIGRTHLQDAVPMSLGDEFSAYARQTALAIRRVGRASADLREVPLGGTAVGTGLNAHPDFAAAVIGKINDREKMQFMEADSRFEAQGARDAAVELSGTLKTVAVSMTKIADDLRWLASGPRCGLGEIRLPALQPGSSIMPGKVNPVISEVVIQVAAQVVGNDTTITFAGQKGQFELNTMQPLIAYNLLQSIDLLGQSARILAEKCVNGIEADEERCAAYMERSLAMVTYLVPLLGYDRAAALSKKAYSGGKSVREVIVAEGIMTSEQFDGLIKRVADERG
ncbi:MAG: class II fumarate hydratase [Deltaproteobacteria bacterium]|nr:class II fumarate hydratase [Deltaproteobacteria bacterium]